MTVLRLGALVAFGLLGLHAVSCQGQQPETSSQTNWLRACDDSSECGEFECLCGTCTSSCDSSPDCGDLDSASCIVGEDRGALAACDGQPAAVGMCLPSCDGVDCPSGSSCRAGVCVGAEEADVVVSIDPEVQHQALIGFGASLGYTENLIASHPDAAALYDAMFTESGFDLIRIRNRFADGSDADLTVAAGIIAEATERLGRAPTLFLTSGSPPATLKANGEQYCSNADVDCTLVRGMDGEFDYAGFAEYWRASLEAYAAVEIIPDYVSIQNNVDWVPEDEVSNEACRFLPQEGLLTVELPDGSTIDAEFPGYDQALSAVSESLGTLPDEYVLAGPETASTLMVGGYTDVLSDVGAIGYHLYGIDSNDPDFDQLETVGMLGEGGSRPIIQSEMQGGGLDTAVLVHQAFTYAETAGYLQLGFVDATWEGDSPLLIGVDGAEVVTLPAYHALAHYSRSTEPGWRRVGSSSDGAEVLVTSWASPEADQLAVVIVNSGMEPSDVEIRVEGPLSNQVSEATVIRTTFEGLERSASLGGLGPERVVRIPGRAIVTVAIGGE